LKGGKRNEEELHLDSFSKKKLKELLREVVILRSRIEAPSIGELFDFPAADNWD